MKRDTLGYEYQLKEKLKQESLQKKMQFNKIQSEENKKLQIELTKV